MREGRRKILRQNLDKSIAKQGKTMLLLDMSYQSAGSIGIKDDYSNEELEKYESLTSRFARASDIMTQKVIKTFLMLIGEDFKTYIDIANICEKLGVAENADTLLLFRDLRNRIAHEYEEEELNRLFAEVLEIIPDFTKTAQNIPYVINIYLK